MENASTVLSVMSRALRRKGNVMRHELLIRLRCCFTRADFPYWVHKIQSAAISLWKQRTPMRGQWPCANGGKATQHRAVHELHGRASG